MHSHPVSTARVELHPTKLGILGKYTKISLIVLCEFQQGREKRPKNGRYKANGWMEAWQKVRLGSWFGGESKLAG